MYALQCMISLMLYSVFQIKNRIIFPIINLQGDRVNTMCGFELSDKKVSEHIISDDKIIYSLRDK